MKIKRLRQQKKQKFVHLAIQIAKIKDQVIGFYNSKESIYLTLLAFVMIYAPYMHLSYYGDSDLKGDFFNFRWMSSFLFALALPSFMLSTGLLIAYLGRKYNEGFFRFLSILVLISGSFYLAWTFWTMPSDFTDMSKSSYFLILLTLSIGFFVLVRYIDKYASKFDAELKRKIYSMQKTLSNYVDLLMKWQYRTDDPNEFRDDLINKTKESGLLK